MDEDLVDEEEDEDECEDEEDLVDEEDGVGDGDLWDGFEDKIRRTILLNSLNFQDYSSPALFIC